MCRPRKSYEKLRESYEKLAKVTNREEAGLPGDVQASSRLHIPTVWHPQFGQMHRVILEQVPGGGWFTGGKFVDQRTWGGG